MVERVLAKLRETDGRVSIIWTPISLLIFCIILTAVIEVIRIQNVCIQVQQTADTAVVSACTKQTPEVYNGAVEGSAISRTPTGESGWDEFISTDIVMELTSSTLGLQKDGREYCKIVDGVEMYRIKNMDVQFDNIEGDVLHFTTEVDLCVPIYYCSRMLPPLERILEVKSSYMLKF